jgi:hypothetical protein
MAWVKRNLGLVIGGAVALVLMVLAGYYLWTKYTEDQAITAQLEETTQRYQELLRRPLHPGTERGSVNNIELAKAEHQRLENFLKEVRARFGKRDIPTNITDRDFRALLDNTIFELKHSAESLGISLPQKDYWFTFAAQRQSVSFKNIEMLTHQLLDIRDLVEILYAARIHDLKGIRRVPASSDDNNSTDFLIDVKPTTNEFAIFTPYELRFQGFSSELARVMEGLINAKRCFVIKTVSVDKAPPDGQPDPMMPQPFMDPRMMMNPRYFNRYAPTPPPQMTAPPPTAGPRRPHNVLLDENKLQFVLMVQAVRLREPGAAGRRPARQPAPEAAGESHAQVDGAASGAIAMSR